MEFKIESTEDQEVDIFILFHANQSLACPISHNLIFDDEESVITSLESSVLVSNSSGCDWSNVTLKIMTGKQAEDPRHAKANRSIEATASFAADSYSLESAGGGAAAESVGERKLFELPPGLDLANGDSNLITLNLATSIPALREYYLDEGVYKNQPVKQKVSFKNLACDKSCGMGEPIAAGTINFYQRDKSGSLQLISDRLQMPDAPTGDTVPLELGGTQDIKASRSLLNQEDVFVDKDGKPLSAKSKADLERQQASQTNRRYIQQNMRRTETFEVSIKNFKGKSVEVAVLEIIGGNQKILKPSSFKLDASTRVAKTTVKVAARTDKGAGEQKLTYVIETLWNQTLQVGD